jgi:hypothetical protein
VDQKGSFGVRKEDQVERELRDWVRPEVKKISAGQAETNATGVDDGGPVGNARS